MKSCSICLYREVDSLSRTLFHSKKCHFLDLNIVSRPLENAKITRHQMYPGLSLEIILIYTDVIYYFLGLILFQAILIHLKHCQYIIIKLYCTTLNKAYFSYECIVLRSIFFM